MSRKEKQKFHKFWGTFSADLSTGGTHPSPFPAFDVSDASNRDNFYIAEMFLGCKKCLHTFGSDTTGDSGGGRHFGIETKHSVGLMTPRYTLPPMLHINANG